MSQVGSQTDGEATWAAEGVLTAVCVCGGGGAVATGSCCVLSVEWAPLLGPWQDGTTC